MNYISLTEMCDILSISIATGRNWVRLGKLIPTYTDGNTPYFTEEYADIIKSEIQSDKNHALKSRRNKSFISGSSFYDSYVSESCLSLDAVHKLLGLAREYSVVFDDDTIQYIVADCALHLFSQKLNLPFNSEKQLLQKHLRGKICLSERPQGNILLSKRPQGNISLSERPQGNIILPEYNVLIDTLIDALIEDTSKAAQFCEEHPFMFDIEYFYEPNEDILGLIYISCKNIGSRKAAGSYYTPTAIANKLTSGLNITGSDRILDPCCGTGNFLLQLPVSVPFDSIYGNDTDKISVKIARINMALKYDNITVRELYSHITEKNYLTEYSEKDFTHIIGNPPWHYKFTRKEALTLSRIYESASCAALGRNVESYDVFIESSFNKLFSGGELTFILPKAILNVKAHAAIRQIIINEASIKYLEYLGNVFDSVQCPSIIMRLKHTEKSLSVAESMPADRTTMSAAEAYMSPNVTTASADKTTASTNVTTASADNSSSSTNGTTALVIGTTVRRADGKVFTITAARDITPEHFCLYADDDEYCVLEKIKHTDGAAYLSGNADFALGIVTGNNGRYVSSDKNDRNEPVIKGSDISRYHIRQPGHYIVYEPDSFQQVAPDRIYRAPEKLLYRFISNKLVFAYDDRQYLPLNSCNVLIPRLPGLNIKYILAILNSSAAQFIYKMEYNSVKVLRSHIEGIPIPPADDTVQNRIVGMADILADGIVSDKESVYRQLDGIIFDLFGLTRAERKIIEDAIAL